MLGKVDNMSYLDQVLNIVKRKLTDPPSDEDLLLDIMEIGQYILNYCNIAVIPEELMFVHANMVLDYYEIQRKSNDDESIQAVSSVKEGDVTVQFGTTKTALREGVTESLLFNYKDQLNKFRKLRW